MSQQKILVLVRHAKSSWEHSGLADYQRPLNLRGERDAPRMGQRLVKRNINLELIISSTAVRALTTAQTIAKKLNYALENIILDESIYGADPRELIDMLRVVDNRYNCIMLVGHNPGITELVYQLSGEDLGNVPTCGIATLSFDIQEWGGVKEGQAQLLDFDYPKKRED